MNEPIFTLNLPGLTPSSSRRRRRLLTHGTFDSLASSCRRLTAIISRPSKDQTYLTRPHLL